jgi:hypothetical protein
MLKENILMRCKSTQLQCLLKRIVNLLRGKAYTKLFQKSEINSAKQL